MPFLSVSAFAADVGHAARDIAHAHAAGADAIHVDVMDGHFVTLTGLGTPWLEAMRPRITLPVDIHLMTLSPRRFIPQFAGFGVSSMSFHIEVGERRENEDALAMIRALGIRAGLAVSPGTDMSSLLPYLNEIDELVVMSSRPGEPGSVFETDALRRIAAARAMADRVRGPERRLRISTDGGLDPDLALACLESGADNVVMGRAFFRHASPNAVADAIHGAGLTRR